MKSPNYSRPQDADQNNTYSVDVIATDASGNTSVKTILINVLDVKGQGQAIDGYLVGATVWADLDGDGIVGVEDLLIVISQWGTCSGCVADIDGNGVVDIEDLLIVIANWG